VGGKGKAVFDLPEWVGTVNPSPLDEDDLPQWSRPSFQFAILLVLVSDVVKCNVVFFLYFTILNMHDSSAAKHSG